MAQIRILCLLLSLTFLIPSAKANPYSKQCSLLGSRVIPVVFNSLTGEYYLSNDGEDELPPLEDIFVEDGAGRMLLRGSGSQQQTKVFSSKEDLFAGLGGTDTDGDATVYAGRSPIKFHHRSAQEREEEEEIVNERHVWGRAQVDYDQQLSGQQTLISLYARSCPCSPQERTFCLAQPHVAQNTCGIPRDSRLPVGCYNLTNRNVFIRNAWPVVVLWYGALFIFLIVTENGKSARNWVLAKICPGRDEHLADAYLQREIVIRDRLRRVRLGRGDRRVTALDEEEGGGLAAADMQRIRTQTLVLKTKRFNAQREKDKRRRRRREQHLTGVEESDASTESAPKTPEHGKPSSAVYENNDVNTPETMALDDSVQSPMSFPSDGPVTTSASADSFQDNEIPQSMSADQAMMLCAPCMPITPVAEEFDQSDDDEEDFTCTICIMEVEDGDKVGALSCNHIFHVECLKEWIKRKNVCPLCQEPEIASPRPGNPDASPRPSPWRAPSPVPDANNGESTNTGNATNATNDSDNTNTTSSPRRTRGLRPSPNRPPLVRRTTLESVRSRLFEHRGSRSIISRDSSGNLVVLSAQSSTVSGPPQPQQSHSEENEAPRVLSGNADDTEFQRRRWQHRPSHQQSRASTTTEDVPTM